METIENHLPNKCKACYKRHKGNKDTVPKMHCTGIGLRMHDCQVVGVYNTV